MSSNLPVPVDTSSSRDMLEVSLQLFAAAAQRAGTRQLQLSVPRGSNVTELHQRLVQLYPELESLANSSRWAVDCEFVEADFRFHRDVELAMIPPVSGG